MTSPTNNNQNDYEIPCRPLPELEFDASEGISPEKLAELRGGLVADEVVHDEIELDAAADSTKEGKMNTQQPPALVPRDLTPSIPAEPHLSELTDINEIGKIIGLMFASGVIGGAAYDMVRKALQMVIRRFGRGKLEDVKQQAIQTIEGRPYSYTEGSEAKKAINQIFSEYE